MSRIDEDISFDELKNRYDFLKYLPLENVFLLFSIKTYNAEYTEDVCSNLSQGNSRNCDLHPLCLSLHDILQNLKRLFEINVLNTKIKWCEYLGYWIYDYIKNRTSCNDSSEFYEKLNLLMSKYLSQYGCNIKYPTIEHEEIIIKKKISLYTEILYWIKNAYYNIFYTYDPMIYDKYLGECFRFYKEVMCNDGSYIKVNYKTQLQEFKNNFNEAITFLKEKNKIIPQIVLPLDEELMCKLEWPNDKARSAEKAGMIREDGGPGDVVQEEEDSGDAQSEHADLAPKGLLGTAGPPEIEGQARPATEQAETLIDGKGPLAEQNTKNVDFNEDTPIPITPNRIGTIGSTVAGSSLFIFMMYKYTPLGSWINTKILGRNKLMENMKNNEKELLLNNSEIGDMNLDHTRYNVMYNSSHNE